MKVKEIHISDSVQMGTHGTGSQGLPDGYHTHVPVRSIIFITECGKHFTMPYADLIERININEKGD